MEQKSQLPIIRSAKGADAPTITKIYIDSWNVGISKLLPRKNLTTERIKRWHQDILMPRPHRWWVAEADHNIVGFVGICPSRDPIDPTLGELNTIAVDPPYWRRGIGKVLMSTAMHHLHTDGYQEAILWTLANYERGQRFYESLGWQQDGGVRDQGRQVRYRLYLNLKTS